jgi:transcriptional regulator with XRE-family HTH domain
MAKIAADLAEQLRRAVRDSGLSLNQLAHKAGLDSGRLSRFMRGERDLTLDGSTKLCGVLGLEFCRTGSGGGTESSGDGLGKQASRGRTRKGK